MGVNYNMPMTGNSEVVFLDFSEDQEPRSERDQKIDFLVSYNRELARKVVTEAKNLADYFLAFRFDFLYGSSKGLTWMDELPTEEEFKSELTNKAFLERAHRVAEKVEVMKKDLDKAPDKVGYVKVVIRQIKDQDSPWGLRVLAKFPKEVLVPHTGFDPNAAQYNDGEQILYFEPNLACFKNAFDDARKDANKNSGDEHQVYYLKLTTPEEASKNIVHGANGVAEYQQGVDESGKKVKQSKDAYMIVSLLGRAAEEDYRVRVSDFWKKQESGVS